MKKLYPEESVQAIADAIRSKRNVQLNKVCTMKIAEMSKGISGIRLGCPINVAMHMQDGEWVRPEGWTDLDALTYGEDELYMTFDASDRIDDSHCAFTINGTSYTVEIGSQSWQMEADSTFSHAFTADDGTYPLVHVKADGHITMFRFATYAVDGKSYSIMQNPLVERVGDVYDYGDSDYGWGTYYLEREKVKRHACTQGLLSNTYQNCYSLQSLDLSGWDTSGWAVTSLAYTFYYCYSLQSLDLSGWDTSGWNVTDMQRTTYIMRACRSLDISSLDMSRVTNWGNSSYPNVTEKMLTDFKCGENNYGKFAPTSYVYLRINSSPLLTRESLLEFAKMLGTVTTKHYFVIGSELSNKLTTAEKAEITAKGWTIS